MKIIKRDKREEDFNGEKIYNAIRKANAATNGTPLSDNAIRIITDCVIEECNKFDRAINIEEIQDMVENELMSAGANDVAKNYIVYRYERMLARNSSNLEDKIMSIVELANEEVIQENSNKNPVVNSTQRDYIAGEVSRDITLKRFFPKDIVEAHKKGIIHIHDTDYLVQRMHNCFEKSTKFITPDGVKSFADCKNGEEVYVTDLYGETRPATVRFFGMQYMNKITFTRTGEDATMIEATADHRWILEDAAVTTMLQVGDTIWGGWTVESIVPDRSDKQEAWCVVEPVTHSFTLDGGIVTGNCDLVNLEDMLQNGTVISDTMIEKPHSFSTACNVATQIVSQVASNQYGLKVAAV